jgi:hypothetical protein
MNGDLQVPAGKRNPRSEQKAREIDLVSPFLNRLLEFNNPFTLRLLKHKLKINLKNRGTILALIILPLEGLGISDRRPNTLTSNIIESQQSSKISYPLHYNQRPDMNCMRERRRPLTSHSS